MSNFLANLHTGEFHDLSATTGDCQISEIKRKRQYASIAAAQAAGFDPCDYCLPQVLAARITVTPAKHERGQTITLDGSKSKPRRGAKKVTEWHWQITPNDGIGQAVTSTEKKLELVLLGNLEVTLTVKDAGGDESPPKKRTITCAERSWDKIDWQTPLDGLGLSQLLILGSLALGRNVCSCSAATPDQSSGHVVHRDAANATWASQFTRKDVPDGAQQPWARCWYVESHSLYIQRAELRSKDLFPGSDLWAANVAAGHVADIRLVRDSVKAHEHFHSYFHYLTWQKRGSEPVKAMEKAVARTEDDLIKTVDAAIIALETDLQADHEAEVHDLMSDQWGGRSATICVHDGAGAFTEITLSDLAQVGDG